MKMSQPLFAFIVLLVVHSFVSFCAYRFLTTTTRKPLPFDSTSVETTTPDQRTRGESSFQRVSSREEVVFVLPVSVRLYVVFGYAGLAVALISAIVSQLRSS